MTPVGTTGTDGRFQPVLKPFFLPLFLLVHILEGINERKKQYKPDKTSLEVIRFSSAKIRITRFLLESRLGEVESLLRFWPEKKRFW